MNGKRKLFKAVTMVTQIGISMMVPTFLCCYGGYQLDKHLGTSYWFLILLFIGFVTAFRNVYYLTKQFYAKDKQREDAEMNYFASLRQNNHDYRSQSKKVRGKTDETKDNRNL